jgi:hypothetical protein
VARLNDSTPQLREGVGLFIYIIIESCSRYGLGSDSLVCQSYNKEYLSDNMIKVSVSRAHRPVGIESNQGVEHEHKEYVHRRFYK